MSNSEYQNTHLAIKEWPDQLTVLKLLYEVDDLRVKYVDDENEQIRINGQDDYDYALNMAANCFNNELRLVLNDSRDKQVAKIKLNISRLLPLHPHAAHKSSQTENHNQSDPTQLDAQLSKLKEEILKDFESKLNTALNNQSLSQKNLMTFSALHDDLDAYFDAVLDMTPDEFQARVGKLLKLRTQAHLNGRQLKLDFVEEELHLSRAFDAEFVQDLNMPDGSVCEPNVRFKKSWLIKNTGKLEWNVDRFPIKLMCVSGNIYSANGDSVDVVRTKQSDTAQISVDLIAPSLPGNYFSEWVLSCDGFKFGPKIWCSIQVAPPAADSKRNSIQSIDSELRSLRSQLSTSSSLLKLSGKEMLIDLDPKHFVEDDDDEFVVVPDCFDLSKKWTKTPSSNDSISLIDSIMSGGDQSFSSSTKFTSNDAAATAKSDESNEQHSILVGSSLAGSRSTLTSDNQSVEHNENEKTLSSSTAAVVFENEKQHPLSVEATSTSSGSSSSKKTMMSPIDIMKNAFSNFSGPSYVGYVGDLVHDASTTTATTASEKANIDKLVQMGFANRKKNERLLKKYNNDVERVVKHLIDQSDSDWSEHRH